jgi:hypothetical protein
MFFYTLRIYKNVVNERYDKLVQFWREDKVHEIYEVCHRIRQHKWHDKILKEAISCSEGRLGYIFGINLDLVIARAEVNLGEHLGSRKLIKQDVSVWKWILVLDSDYIERSIIHT